MKKFFLLILAGFTAFTIAEAQTLQPIIGIAYSEINCPSIKTGAGEQYKPGILAGIGYEHHLTRHLYAGIEATYVDKGYNYYLRQDDQANPLQYTITNYSVVQHYLEFPLTLKEYFPYHHVEFFLEGGPYLGIGMGGKYKGEYSVYESGTEKECSSWNKRIKYGQAPERTGNDELYVDHRLDIGYIVGAGIVINKAFCIDFRYVHGKIEEKGDLSRAFELSVAIPFELHKRHKHHQEG